MTGNIDVSSWCVERPPVSIVVSTTKIVCLSPHVARSDPWSVKPIDPTVVIIHITKFVDVVSVGVFRVLPARVSPDIALAVPLSPISLVNLAVSAKTRRLPGQGIKTLWLGYIYPTRIHELFIHVEGFHPKLAIFIDISPKAFHDFPTGKLVGLNPDVIFSRGDNVRRYVRGTQ
jgi:hypothetical protein